MVWVVWSEKDTQDMLWLSFALILKMFLHGILLSFPNLCNPLAGKNHILSQILHILISCPSQRKLLWSFQVLFSLLFFSSLSAAITMIINNWEKKTQRLNILILLYFWVQNIENIGTNKKTTTIYLKDLQCGNQKAWKTDSMRNNSVLQETNIETEISETPYLRSKVTSISSNKLQCWQEIFMGITSSNDEAPLFTESCYLWDSK